MGFFGASFGANFASVTTIKQAILKLTSGAISPIRREPERVPVYYRFRVQSNLNATLSYQLGLRSSLLQAQEVFVKVKSALITKIKSYFSIESKLQKITDAPLNITSTLTTPLSETLTISGKQDFAKLGLILGSYLLSEELDNESI